MSSLHGFGLGIASDNAEGDSLDAFYPRPLAQVTGVVADILQGVAGRLDAAQLKELASALEQAGETGLASLEMSFPSNFGLPQQPCMTTMPSLS